MYHLFSLILASAVIAAVIWTYLMRTSGPSTFEPKDLFLINWRHHGPKSLAGFLTLGAIAGLVIFAIVKAFTYAY